MNCCMRALTLLAVAGIAVLLSGCSAGPQSEPSSQGVIRGTLLSCGPASPVLTLHERDGRVVATSVWHPPTSGPSVAGKRTLDFSFAIEPGAYYLTMNNEYQMPPQDRQIELVRNQVFTTHIVACS